MVRSVLLISAEGYCHLACQLALSPGLLGSVAHFREYAGHSSSPSEAAGQCVNSCCYCMLIKAITPPNQSLLISGFRWLVRSRLR